MLGEEIQVDSNRKFIINMKNEKELALIYAVLIKQNFRSTLILGARVVQSDCDQASQPITPVMAELT